MDGIKLMNESLKLYVFDVNEIITFTPHGFQRNKCTTTENVFCRTHFTSFR